MPHTSRYAGMQSLPYSDGASMQKNCHDSTALPGTVCLLLQYCWRLRGSWSVQGPWSPTWSIGPGSCCDGWELPWQQQVMHSSLAKCIYVTSTKVRPAFSTSSQFWQAATCALGATMCDALCLLCIYSNTPDQWSVIMLWLDSMPIKRPGNGVIAMSKRRWSQLLLFKICQHFSKYVWHLFTKTGGVLTWICFQRSLQKCQYTGMLQAYSHCVTLPWQKSWLANGRWQATM